MEPQLESLTAPEAAANDATQSKPAPLTKEEILAKMVELSGLDATDINREDVNRLRVQFYNIRHEDVAAQKAEYLAAGNSEETFEPAADETEEQFKAAYTVIKDKKAALAAEIELQKQENLAKKNAIIAEIEAAADDADNVHLQLNRVRELQTQFKEIGDVPAPEVSDLWKRYQLATEKFYDQWKVNKDLRDLDFRKNLESKTLICEEAARLNEEPDIVVAFRRLQDLHDKWREIGPVAKEFREEIWSKFKDLSAEINRKYQAFFEERKAIERQNEASKLALIEKIDAIKPEELTTFSAWDEATKQVIELQEQWKGLGFASRKTNAQLFQQFRELCDAFFQAKAAHFKDIKEESAENLAKKICLCEQAEELQDSTDWRKATDALIALQAKWKTIGPVSKKQGDAVWTRFRTACDKFFDAKKANDSERRSSEQANLKAKRDIIEQLKGITAESGDRKGAIAKVRELMKEYQGVGHVPFKEKDKLHDAYRAEVSRLHDELDMSTAKAAMAAFENDVNSMGGNDLSRQKEKLMRSLDLKKQEIKTFENNLGFFSSKSKSGDAMVRDMERRIARLRDEQANIEKKIQLINEKLNA
ncbi:MAG: DUF349 domain-containing protein [Bacteroides sp.]|nr:DUF349 domain-containing protein [Bacteroides sp.]MCM1380221.1 DUF349 domain-containing protein [Bacteroides sp.]MCM1446520.1 DUF349 domain-containing protein [Prevotella sp.]